jgi:VanZ family protein
VFQYKFSILLAIVISLLSLAPASRFPIESVWYIPYIDKIVHIIMYASFGFVALMESRCSRKCHGYHLLILLGIFLASALIEVLQATVVLSRGAELVDLLANFLGLMVAYLAFRLIGGWGLFRFLKS